MCISKSQKAQGEHLRKKCKIGLISNKLTMQSPNNANQYPHWWNRQSISAKLTIHKSNSMDSVCKPHSSSSSITYYSSCMQSGSTILTLKLLPISEGNSCIWSSGLQLDSQSIAFTFRVMIWSQCSVYNIMLWISPENESPRGSYPKIMNDFDLSSININIAQCSKSITL